MLTMFPLALGLAATAKPVITLFAGQQYEAGWPVLATLALFGLVYGFSPAFSNLLLIYGKTKTILLVNLTSVALSLTMLPTLQFLGLTGLATVRGASLLLSFSLNVYFISKTIKIEIDRQTAWKALT
jgi:O-antigen/teichoic acid export membrane protein